MSEVNPDPIAKLAKFTPAAAPDAAELLFAAGRASARTHWGWKAAVAGLFASNLVLGVLLAFGGRDVPPSPTVEPPPAVQPQPVPVLAPPSPATPAEEPWSYRTLRALDLEHSPKPETFSNANPSREALTVLSGRNGDID